ncbi:hypothetical protein BKCO1_6000196 [Neofusicoccum parvum]|uniref:Uncharacterized protein n=1 Tax=Neofusicoccum parvum TaxID=310453 RepID=A0ACB5RX04_9PEZI|nr:hypothetical protein BKCO1_6000196 [Neofusicoccum parvum]
MPPIASPPLPGTAVTSDDARYWRDVHSSADTSENSNTNGSSSNNANANIDGDVTESLRKISLGGDSRYGEDVADRNLTEHFPKPPTGPVISHAENTAGRYAVADTAPLFLEDSSDEEVSGEHGQKRNPASLRRKKGHRGLRNFSNPRNDYSVQEPTRTPGYFGMMNGVDGYDMDRASQSYLIDDTPKQSLDGVVDLRDTEDIAYHSRYAPAVTHETIHPEVHHIREEQIFREVHTHDVFHRVLPIIDVEVLPARHFVPTEDGELREMPEVEIPGRSNDDQARNWLVAEVVSRITRDDEAPVGPRQFTAREFHGVEGDERRYVTGEGFEGMETTWVHPPTVETGARESGQTEPLYMRSPVPDGHVHGGLEAVQEEEEEISPQKSLKDLAGGVHDCPFEECAKFENKGAGDAQGKLVA